MKKNRDADALAARLSAAAVKPPVVVAMAVAPREPKAPTIGESLDTFEQKAAEATLRGKSKGRSRAAKSEGTKERTVAISLRPGESCLIRYVLAASERTREVGRVISAQDMMLEVLERGP